MTQISEPAARVAAGQITLRELLRDRSFGPYLIGQTSSAAGSALSSVALVFAVMSISSSAASVGLVLLAARLPGIVFTLVGGMIADRWPRQRVALLTDLFRTVVQLTTGVLLLTGHATVLLLVVLQLGAGSASAIFAPTATALVAQVAPGGQTRRANSLLGMTSSIAQTGGLAVSGAIVALAGPGSSFLIDGATFAVSTAMFMLIPVAPVGAGPDRAGLIGQLREGVRAVTERGWLCLSTLQSMVVNTLVLSPFFVLGPVVAKDRLGGATAWSLIALGYVLGNLAAAHITYRWAPARPILVSLLITTGLAPLMGLLGVAAPLWLIVPAAFLAGAEGTISNTLLASAEQANLPDAVLARAVAVASLGSSALAPLGMGLAGVLAAALGTKTVMLAACAVALLLPPFSSTIPAARVRLSLDRAA